MTRRFHSVVCALAICGAVTLSAPAGGSVAQAEQQASTITTVTESGKVWTRKGAQLVLAPDSQNDDQRWILEPADPGSVYIRNQNGKDCVTAEQDVMVRQCNELDVQMWRVHDLGGGVTQIELSDSLECVQHHGLDNPLTAEDCRVYMPEQRWTVTS